MKAGNRRIRVLCMFAALAVLTGCGTFSEVRFTVDPSVVDFVHVHASTEGAEGEAPVYTRVELSGGGFLLLRRGRSERVKNPYWQAPSGDEWGDLHTDQVVIATEKTQEYLQEFVDAGLFDRRPAGDMREEAGAGKILVVGKVSGERGYVLTDDPGYLAIYKRLLEEFRR